MNKRIRKQIEALEYEAAIEITNDIKTGLDEHGISVLFFVEVKTRLQDHFRASYKGSEEFGDLLARSLKPRPRGCAAELRKIMKTTAKHIRDMQTQGYDYHSICTILRLMK